jgi:uracil-DNA glycosylase
MPNSVKIEPSWYLALENYFDSPDFHNLAEFVKQEYRTKTVYPRPADIFRAFWLTPLQQVRVVILGQDPYHGPGQAMGLSFSVPAGMQLPPSLQNIYTEIEAEFGLVKDRTNGNLEVWARQGVFLLNAVLTVVAGTPTSHQKKGWEKFTDTVIKTISDQRENVVFMLWGAFARSKKSLIDQSRHLVLESAHPSPLSAHNGFFGNGHFKKCNQYLLEHGQKAIQW